MRLNLPDGDLPFRTYSGEKISMKGLLITLLLTLISCSQPSDNASALKQAPSAPIQKTDDGGSGVGNGGLGYICTANNNEQVSFILDIAEDLDQFYDQEYFEKYNRKKHILFKYLNNPETFSKNNNCNYSKKCKKTWSSKHYQGYAVFITTYLQLYILEVMLPNLSILEKHLSPSEQVKLKKIAQQGLSVHVTNDFSQFSNISQDTGHITSPAFEKFELKSCELFQVALFKHPLTSENLSSEKSYLKIYSKALLSMDELNIKALVWHEIIYMALEEKTSERTRSIVSQIMRDHFSLLLD